VNYEIKEGVSLLNIPWKNSQIKLETWEMKDRLRKRHPHLFQIDDMNLNFPYEIL
jgi:hypothetical protein